MGSINVEYINPFIGASTTVLSQMANIEAKIGKPYVRQSPYTGGDVVILIGITGEIKGQVIFSFKQSEALKIASGMMGGMALTELDEISKSAISEMTNMILGNAATLLSNKGIVIDITPPSLLMGQSLQISTQKMTTVCIPLELSVGGVIEIDVAISE
jgi:chemotaxis protein CheX